MLWEKSGHGVTSDKSKLSVCRSDKGIKKQPIQEQCGVAKNYVVMHSHISQTKNIRLAVKR